MIFTSILKFIVVKALPLFKNILFYLKGISVIIFIYIGVLFFNTLYIQLIGSNIGIYSGLFQNNHDLISLGILINKNNFHTSSILNSSKIRNKNNNITSQITECSTPTIEEQLQERVEKINLNKLNSNEMKEQLLFEFKDKYGVDLNYSSSPIMSSYGESFPWFVDENNQIIDYNKSIRLFDAVNLVSRYLETRYKLDPNLISEVKISELLESFKENKEITVLELFNHVQNTYYKNENQFIKIHETIIPSNDSQQANTLLEFIHKNKNKPINQINFKDVFSNLTPQEIFNNITLNVHPIPVALNLISYGFILRAYMKHVHNRPYNPNLNEEMLAKEKLYRSKTLFIFALIGAPLITCGIRLSTIPFKESITIQFPSKNSETTTNSLFLAMLTNFKDKLPLIIKILLIPFILFIICYIFYGSKFIIFIKSSYFFKLYAFGGLSIAITYEILNLFFLYKFSKKSIVISEMLPDFLINHLKQLEMISQEKNSLQFYKNYIYFHIFMYIGMLIITLIILHYKTLLF